MEKFDISEEEYSEIFKPKKNFCYMVEETGRNRHEYEPFTTSFGLYETLEDALERYKKEREDKLEEIKYLNKTILFYEAPHKLKTTLESIFKILGNRNIVLAKEITKIHETFIRGKVEDILKSIEEPKGEFVIVIEGSEITQKEIEKISEVELKEFLSKVL